MAYMGGATCRPIRGLLAKVSEQCPLQTELLL